ncbi:LysR substrate-binding domain-containing protein [Kumtagia ephedrae]|uniref:LysR substrate-binding domain-containing protein n=1 Tax=Kumtagia ephedrae TaxID=2116701 RepID=UPI003CC9D9FA
MVAVRPNGRLRSDSGEALMQWAVAGLGIANTPSFLIGNELEDGRLEIISTNTQHPMSASMLCARRGPQCRQKFVR